MFHVKFRRYRIIENDVFGHSKKNTGQTDLRKGSVDGVVLAAARMTRSSLSSEKAPEEAEEISTAGVHALSYELSTAEQQL